MATRPTARFLADTHPLKLLLDNPAVYVLVSLLAVLAIFTHYVKYAVMFDQGFRADPLSCVALFNAFVACIYFLYYTVCIVCFHERPSYTEHLLIGDKLSSFVPWKIVLILFVIEPDVFDFAVWVVWVGLLVAAKVRRALINFQTRFFCSQYVYFLRGCMQAVLHLGLLRLADAADGGEAVPLPALLWPSLHLILVRVVPLFSCL